MSENETPPTPPVVPSAPAAASLPLFDSSSGAPTPIQPTAPAPTVPLRAAGAPLVGAPTIKLATTNAPVGAPTIALRTANTPFTTAGAASIALPKATVSITPPTRPLSPGGFAATQKPTFSSEEEPDDETGAETFAKILASVGFAAALVVLGIQFKISSIWIGVEDNNKQGEWSQLLE